MTEKEAIQKLMALCSRKEYSTGEIKTKLEEWEVQEDLAAKVVATLIAEKFIDDNRYASAFINDKLKFSKWGKIKIQYSLRQKGVADELISEKLAETDKETYLGLLVEELRKKRKSIKAPSDYELKGKLIQFATGRGFEFDVAAKAAEVVMKSNFK